MSAGVFGYLGYDMVRQMERLAPAKPDPIGVPEALLIRPTVMVVFDSVRDEMSSSRRSARSPASPPAPPARRREARIEAVVARARRPARPCRRPPSIRRCWPTRRVSNTSEAEFLGMVGARARIYPRRRRFPDRAVAAFHQPLRPAGVLALSRAAARQPVAVSLLSRFRRLPDRRLQPGNPGARCIDGKVTIRPIAGTRWRGKDGDEDAALAEELLADPKERAEHLMLLDLGRNDVGRVAEIGSVKVTDFVLHRALQPRHAHRLQRRGPAEAATRRARRARGRLPRRHGVGRAEGAGDADHRRVGEGQARHLRRLHRLFRAPTATWTPASCCALRW